MLQPHFMRPLSSSALHTKLIHKYAVLIIIVKTVGRDPQPGVADHPSTDTIVKSPLGSNKMKYFKTNTSMKTDHMNGLFF